MEWPMLSSQNDLLGAVSVLFELQAALGAAIDPLLLGTDYACRVIQTDGTVLDYTDPAIVGKNLLTDAEFTLYTGLRTMVERIAAEESGAGSYNSAAAGTGFAFRHCTWTTVGLHGTNWRVVITAELLP